MILPRPRGTAAGDQIVGERSLPSVSAQRSLQSRVSSIMACAVMLIFGAGMLTWYYSNALSRASRQQSSARSTVARTAQGEMPLPAIEGFNLLGVQSAPVRGAAPLPTPRTVGELPPLPAINVAELPLSLPAPSRPRNTGVRRPEDPQKRLLSGVVFARQSGLAADGRSALATSSTGAEGGFAASSSRGDGNATLGGSVTGSGGTGYAGNTGGTGYGGTTDGAGGTGSGGGAASVSGLSGAGSQAAADGEEGLTLASLLQPSVIAAVRPAVVPTQRFLLPKGAFIDCTLETAIDSTLPGMTTCITATDTFSADGMVVLLERGTKLVGETRGQVAQGAARVFVLWTQARTPAGVVVPLDSPGTDELGRSGLSGQVNRHFWQRFGAAILVSTLDGAVQAAVQSASRSGGPVIYSPSAPAGVATDVLKNSVNIPPTITKANGDRIQVLVARDMDFRSVYELRTPAAGR